MDKKKQTCRIRVRNSHTERIPKLKELCFAEFDLKCFRKQLNPTSIPSFTVLPSLRTDLLLNSRRIALPSVSVDSIKNRMRRSSNPEKSIGETENGVETDCNGNDHHFNESKPSFRSKRVPNCQMHLKSNNSSVLTSKCEPHPFDLFHETDRYNLNSHLNDLANTSTSQRAMMRRNKEKKCLIAVSRKLPFSLQRRQTKKRQTQITQISNSIEELFDLDISVIIDGNQGPATPFIRRGSDIEGVFNFA